MIGTIAPVVHGSRAKVRWLVAWALFGLGAATSAGVLGVLLGFAGRGVGAVLPTGWGWSLLAVGAVAYSLHEFGLVSLPKPQRTWQVPAGWRVRYHPWPVALAYGLLLGCGVLTYISSPTFYIALLCAATIADPVISGLTLACYGVALALPLLVLGWSVNSHDSAYEASVRVFGRRRLMHGVSGVVLLGVAAYVAAWRL